MLQSEFVLAHLRQNCTDVQMDVAGVRNLKAVVNRLLAEVQVVIFNFEGFFQEAQRGSQLLRSSKDARKIVVSHCAVPITLICVGFCLLQ